jgi:hypothetical protein
MHLGALVCIERSFAVGPLSEIDDPSLHLAMPWVQFPTTPAYLDRGS